MGDQLDQIRREAEKKRRKEWKPADSPKEKTHLAYYPSREEMNEHEPEFYMWRDDEKKMKTSSRNEKVRQRFFIQWLCALGIFVVTAIVAQTNQASLEPVRQTAMQWYGEEFQFAAVSGWYEEQFGRPLALFPGDLNESGEQIEAPIGEGYALPAAGIIEVRESFSENGQAMIVETAEDAMVTAARGGVVIRAGADSEWGDAVVVQHEDGTEAMYGTLDAIDVNLYDHVQSGDVLGAVTTSDEFEGGSFMFGLRKNNEFIDPNEVMTFD
ncbi:peptidoglycan DD-metalloendopeptidase family protein [Geomicrobium sp. JSM 1781026]|uniref:peptidoglycan DD-metalloendopeptidase family protein n=1 Tax=Geomicrobium sp. JSM 1781026 TaxID=3344580 RepID=UPI0035C19F68